MSRKRILFSIINGHRTGDRISTRHNFSYQLTTQTAKAAGATKPLVAIHVSELTQALESMPAVAPTPTGTGTTDFQWFYTSWHYFVIPNR